jgi:CHAT domain-containing protein/tetratricopeptide (TPR) repeat protein
VLKNYWKQTAVIGLTLTALSLNGSPQTSATLSTGNVNSVAAVELRARKAAAQGNYRESRALFLDAASLAQKSGDPGSVASSRNGAGIEALSRLDYRDALADFLEARQAAQTSRQFAQLAKIMNNLANLYLHMGNPAAAEAIAKRALDSQAGSADPTIRPQLRYQLAKALASQNRFDEAKDIYRLAIEELKEQGDLETAARILSSLGSSALEANRVDEAESALSEALMLVRVHKLAASANVLHGLAMVKSRQGDTRTAQSLFTAAIDAPPGLTQKWVLYADRGQFRLEQSDLQGALGDFREAHRLASLMRADIVPADQDRISLESSGLSRIGAGLIEAGNRLARQTSDRVLLGETFDAAEEDRSWSLRALVPASNDWRARLPESYWDSLARYQSIERQLIGQTSPELQKKATALQIKLQEIEATAAPARVPEQAQSALEHVRSVLDEDSVLFSFSVTRYGGWVWAIDRTGVDVYAISSGGDLKIRVAEFALATKQGDARAVAMGNQLYHDLFGGAATAHLAHKRWLLELDGPLFDLPFAALVTNDVGTRKNEPIYLVERAALESIPDALMLERQTPPADGGFLGIGDPVYNAADARYRGAAKKQQDIVLPRLPETANELQACSRAWGGSRTRILTGSDADLANIRSALDTRPAVIHFATHVVTAPGDHASGLIALSLDRSGAMGLMGPTEIVAHPVSADLVVLNGCHSGQGDALPGAGLMGLTRAWIGAGARSVLATGWDIPDEAGKNLMVEFYRASRAHPERGPAFALQQAQLAAIKQSTKNTAAVWAAYFLLGRE